MSNNQAKQINKTDSLFDASLTPQNAKKRGYYYIDDVIYDFLYPSETIIDILDFLREFRGKLGTPTNTNSNESFFGLYIPTNQISNES